MVPINLEPKKNSRSYSISTLQSSAFVGFLRASEGRNRCLAMILECFNFVCKRKQSISQKSDSIFPSFRHFCAFLKPTLGKPDILIVHPVNLLRVINSFLLVCFNVDHCIVFRLKTWSDINKPSSTYQYSSMAPRLSSKNCKFLKFLLSLNFQKRLGFKENNTKYRSLTRKPRSHIRILIYRTWLIPRLSDRRPRVS